MKRSHDDAFGFEIVTDGKFEDEGFKIRTIVVRLSGSAMNKWIMSGLCNCREVYETSEEWETYKKMMAKKRNEWNKKILEKFNFIQSEGFAISQSASEIFTIVLFEK